MADIEFRDVGGGQFPAEGINVAVLINWLGALVSVTLIAGLAWWGYQLMVRDVSGVPVIRALEGPMRVAPDDPGGVAAEYQGLAVNNIPAEGEAAPPADRLVLAAPPTGLTSEDLPEKALAPLTRKEAAAPPVRPQAAQPAQRPEAQQPGPGSDDNAVMATPGSAEAGEVVATDRSALIEAALRQAVGDSPAAVPAQAAPKTAADPVLKPSDILPADVPGRAVSPRPRLRPEHLVASAAATAPSGPAPATAGAMPGLRIVDPASIAPGTRLAQLGAFETREMAEKEWTRLSGLFEDFMADKGRVIAKARSGGKVFYRLRAEGFSDLSDARRFCAALLAGNANCIPVTQR